MKNNIVPIFYICDNNYMKYINVSVKSIIENSNKDTQYEIHVLNTDITEETIRRTRTLETENVKIKFDDVTDRFNAIKEKLFVRDYYNMTTYYRFFIADMFPEFDKVIYIDGDTVVLDDIAKLYNIDLENNLIAGAHEQAFVQVDLYGRYVEEVLGVSRYECINAGVMLMDVKAFREEKILETFVRMLGEYKFVVTQDEDYLNVICNGRIKFLDLEWNAQTFKFLDFPVQEEDIHIIHYDMSIKPWYFLDCRLSNYFWEYAAMTDYYAELKHGLETYTEEQKQKALNVLTAINDLVISEIERPDNYYKMKLAEANSTLVASKRASKSLK